MAYHAMPSISGKLVGVRGLGADSPEFEINEQTVAFLAAMDCTAWQQVTNLNASMVQLLAATFLGTPPPGVSQNTFDAFTLRALACNLYDLPGTSEADAWLREAFPMPACLDDPTIGVIMYGRAHSWKGDDREKNMLVWLMSKSPNNMYLYDLKHIPPCDKGCHNRYQMELVLRCMMDPVDSICASTPAINQWYQAHRDKRLCPTLRGQIQGQIDALSCDGLRSDIDLDYCAQHGYQGPEPARNAACWTLWTAQRLQGTLERCAPPPAPTPPPPAEEPSPVVVAPVTEESPEVAPAPALAPPQVQPTWPTPSAPPAEKKMSAATMGIIGVLGLAAVGGVVLATRKKRR
jgi:hypothetical protein